MKHIRISYRNGIYTAREGREVLYATTDGGRMGRWAFDVEQGDHKSNDGFVSVDAGALILEDDSPQKYHYALYHTGYKLAYLYRIADEMAANDAAKLRVAAEMNEVYKDK